MVLPTRDLGGDLARSFGQGFLPKFEEGMTLAQKRNAAQRLQQNLASSQAPETPSGFMKALLDAQVAGADPEELRALAATRISLGQQSANMPQSSEEFGHVLQSLGVPPQDAETYARLYQNLSTGGKTSFANNLLEKLQRGGFEPSSQSEVQGEVQLLPKERVRRQEALLKLNEPKLTALQDKLRSLENENIRYARLQELSNNPDAFPNRFTSALFTSGGELRPTALAALSEDAQEFIKLLADSASGAKDTFGSRVTNFDLQSYMKRLPSLLNSAEGRKRVLRDLQIINEINRKHAEAIGDEFDRAGGIDKISFSEAERRATKSFKHEINDLKQQFVSGRPSAIENEGRKIVDDRTGKIYRSNGRDWIEENR